MFRFRLFNIPVFVHPWFWITLALIGSGVAKNGFLYLAMFVLAGFVSILVHEFGHALMIRKYGLPTEVHLVAFGGFARHPAGQLDRKQSFLVTAAGPAIQFVLGIVAVILLQVLPFPEGSLLQIALSFMALVSFVWSILNCLPIHPMDGGQMLAAVLGPQRAPLVHLIGIVTAVAIGLLAFFVLNALILLLFMGFFAYQNWQQYQASKR
ncbi:MAG: metalloprotease [Coraliomargarita sp.]